jgi:dimethylargininase
MSMMRIAAGMTSTRPYLYLSRCYAQSLSTTAAVKRSSSTYNFAITRDVPSSFPNALSHYYNAHDTATEEPTAISLEQARQQHEQYVKTLRTCVPTLCLPPLEEHADSVFVEDTVVAIGDTAVITKPGHPSREGEVDTIKDILQRLGMNVLDMRSDFADMVSGMGVLCDGGDVLYTGRHLFVGLSKRTNQQAVDMLQQVFQGVTTTIAVPMDGDEALHLKSVVTHMDAHTLVAPVGAWVDDWLKDMSASELGYDVIRVPQVEACNIVTVNGSVLAQDVNCKSSRGILEAAAIQRNLQLKFVNTSEFAKVDGALTCCSVLLSL